MAGNYGRRNPSGGAFAPGKRSVVITVRRGRTARGRCPSDTQTATFSASAKPVKASRKPELGNRGADIDRHGPGKLTLPMPPGPRHRPATDAERDVLRCTVVAAARGNADGPASDMEAGPGEGTPWMVTLDPEPKAPQGSTVWASSPSRLPWAGDDPRTRTQA